MSIDLTVIPTTAACPTWRELLAHWQSYLPSEYQSLLEGARVYGADLPESRRVATLPQLDLDSRLQVNYVYEFGLTLPNNLVLWLCPLSEEYDTVNVYLLEDGEGAYVHDSLSPEEAAELARLWRSVNFDYSLTTTMGRSVMGPMLFMALACSLARFSNGYICFTTVDGFTSVPPGIWEPEVYEKA